MVARMASAALVVVAVTQGAVAEPKPKPVDIKPFRDKLVVLKDADGGIYALSFERDEEPHVFYGTGKQLYEQVLEGSKGRNGDAWTLSLQAPRIAFPFAAVLMRRTDGTYARSCGKELDTELTQVTGDRAKEILDKSSFLTTQLTRVPQMLARDDRGIYYYVDVLRSVYGGNGHRLFVGKKGAMKAFPVVDVVADTAGEIYSTKTGDLRLVQTTAGAEAKPSAQWIRGERKNELVLLDTYMSQPLIFRDLGIYKLAGTVCDNL